MTEEFAENKYLNLSFVDKSDENNTFLKPSLGI